MTSKVVITTLALAFLSCVWAVILLEFTGLGDHSEGFDDMIKIVVSSFVALTSGVAIGKTMK